MKTSQEFNSAVTGAVWDYPFMLLLVIPAEMIASNDEPTGHPVQEKSHGSK